MLPLIKCTSRTAVLSPSNVAYITAYFFQIDEIPLFEVASVKDARTVGDHLHDDNLDAAENQQLFQNAIVIATIPGGYNSGRIYHLRANSPQACHRLIALRMYMWCITIPGSCQECSRILAELSVFSTEARKRARSSNRFATLQRRVRRVYNSRPFQAVSIACIVLVIGTAGPRVFKRPFVSCRDQTRYRFLAKSASCCSSETGRATADACDCTARAVPT